MNRRTWAGPVLRAAPAAALAASRSIGVFGFTERGLQPSPQSLISIVVEVMTLLLLAPALLGHLRRVRTARSHPGT
jgi:hypothetical protein